MTTPLRILDISDWQGSVDVAAVKASGVAGLICKLSEGTFNVQSTFRRDWDGAGAQGLWRAAYHFARADTAAAPEAEADHLLATLPALETGDAVALDLEVGSGDLSAYALRWMRRVEDKIGVRPLFYSYLAFIEEHLTAPTLAAYPLWLAAYGSQQPATPAPWTATALWQHTQTARVNGIDGNVDESLFGGTVEQLRAFGKSAPPPFKANWLLVTAQDRRAAPRVQEPKLPLLPAGTKLEQLTYPQTTMAYNPAHWIVCRTEAGLTSWIDKANLRPL